MPVTCSSTAASRAAHPSRARSDAGSFAFSSKRSTFRSSGRYAPPEKRPFS
jgi:hypothetical protein